MIARLPEDTTFPDFFVDHLLKNVPAILPNKFTEQWPARRKWANADGTPNWDFLAREYGTMRVPVLVADDHCNYLQMPLNEFIAKFIREGSGVAYVKDWHFQANSDAPPVYEPPTFLKFDWVSNQAWTSDIFSGDYRFVYIGTKDSWTKFHSDVMGSYSWSANICGRKRWLMVPAGKEDIFRINNDFCEDIRQCTQRWAEAGVMDFVQEPGEVVFVPSGWYHQVHNLTDAVSINHNTMNACNIDHVAKLVLKRLADVKAAIDDVRGVFSEEEFFDQCQTILRADLRINIPLMTSLADHIMSLPSQQAYPAVNCSTHDSVFDCKTNNACLERFRGYLKSNCSCRPLSELCHSCDKVMQAYQLECATAVKKFLDGLSL